MGKRINYIPQPHICAKYEFIEIILTWCIEKSNNLREVISTHEAVFLGTSTGSIHTIITGHNQYHSWQGVANEQVMIFISGSVDEVRYQQRPVLNNRGRQYKLIKA